MTPIVHVAGLDVTVGPNVRQRCAWCGAVLVDVDVRMIAVHSDDGDTSVPTWRVGSLVRVDGGMSFELEHEDGAQVPADCCAALDPSVTA